MTIPKTAAEIRLPSRVRQAHPHHISDYNPLIGVDLLHAFLVTDDEAYVRNAEAERTIEARRVVVKNNA